MARMQGVDESRAGPILRWFFGNLRGRMNGKLAETWPIMAHNSNVMRGWAMQELFLDRARDLDAKLRKLVELKVSLMVGCPT